MIVPAATTIAQQTHCLRRFFNGLVAIVGTGEVSSQTQLHRCGCHVLRCFRKETQGAHHAAEFTMLNLCEFGLPEASRQERLEGLADRVMTCAGIDSYQLVSETSAVYGATVDVVSDGGLELGSGAMGPHPLDRAWRITDTWVGIGFGLERLLMAAEDAGHLARYGRSITYLDGVRLNI